MKRGQMHEPSLMASVSSLIPSRFAIPFMDSQIVDPTHSTVAFRRHTLQSARNSAHSLRAMHRPSNNPRRCPLPLARQPQQNSVPVTVETASIISFLRDPNPDSKRSSRQTHFDPILRFEACSRSQISLLTRETRLSIETNADQRSETEAACISASDRRFCSTVGRRSSDRENFKSTVNTDRVVPIRDPRRPAKQRTRLPEGRKVGHRFQQRVLSSIVVIHCLRFDRLVNLLVRPGAQLGSAVFDFSMKNSYHLIDLVDCLAQSLNHSNSEFYGDGQRMDFVLVAAGLRLPSSDSLSASRQK